LRIAWLFTAVLLAPQSPRTSCTPAGTAFNQPSTLNHEAVMEDFLSQNQMYIVLVITMIAWAGIVSYLFKIERKLKHLEEQLKKEER
jgi:CcmD family protein